MDCFATLAMTKMKTNNTQGEKLMAASTAPASKSGLYADPREDWLAQYTEEIIDPARPIVDPHHHLWDRGGLHYMIEEMVADINSGHNIVATVYVDCRSMYRAHGPEAFRPVGEVEFANGVEQWPPAAAMARRRSAPALSATSTCCSATARRRCWKRR